MTDKVLEEIRRQVVMAQRALDGARVRKVGAQTRYDEAQTRIDKEFEQHKLYKDLARASELLGVGDMIIHSAHRMGERRLDIAVALQREARPDREELYNAVRDLGKIEADLDEWTAFENKYVETYGREGRQSRD